MAKPVKTRNAQHVTPIDVGPAVLHWRWAILALVVVTVSLAYPIITGAFLANPHSDQYIAGYAFREFAAQSLRSGHGFPQWNSYMLGGMPFVAALHGDIFYPTFLLRLVLRTDLAITLSFVAHLFLAGVFMLGFLRAVGVTRWAALFGGVAYMLSGPITSYAASGGDGQLFVSALLPLALWMLLRAVRDSRQYAWGVFALAVGLAALSGNPQLLQYFLLTCVAFAALLVWNAARDDSAATLHARILPVLATAADSKNFHTESSVARANTSHRTKYLATQFGVVLAVVLLGLCIGAIQYWPALGYLSSSAAANGLDYAAATKFSLPPEELLNTYLPQFSGLLQRYWGRNLVNLQSVYVGVAVLMMALLAFGDGSRKRHKRFWLGVCIVACIWALGSYTPLFHAAYSLVPGAKFVQSPSAIFSVVALSLCVLSAFGVERVLAQQISSRALNRHIVGWAVFGTLIVVLSASGALSTFSHWLVDGTPSLMANDQAYASRVIDSSARPLLMGALRSLAVVVVIALAMKTFQRQRIRATTFAVMLLATCAVDLWSIARRYWIFSSPASELYRSDAVLSYLQTQEQPGRVFVYTKTSDFRAATDPYFGSTGFGDGAGLMVYGIRSVSGYHHNPMARYEALANRGALIDPAFWQHENVRWLYSNAEIADSVLKKVIGPVTNSAGSTSVLYEMPGSNSYAWVASSFGTRTDSAAVKELLSDSYDPHRFVSVDTATVLNGAHVDPAPALFSEPSAITTTVTDFGAGRATVTLSAPSEAGNALVISENYYKGWRATANGKELPVIRASFNLVGVPLPVGARTVSFSFEDPRNNTGRFITLGALLLTALLTLTGWRRHRQTSAQFADAYKTTRDDVA